MFKILDNQPLMLKKDMGKLYPKYSLLYIRKGYRDGYPQGILVAMADDDDDEHLVELQQEYFRKGIETMITIPLVGGAGSLCQTEFEIR